MDLLVGLGVLAFYGELWLLWQLAKLLWRFLLWVTKPIRDEIAFQKMVHQELEKESHIREAHRQAIEEIDQTVSDIVDYHERSIS
jgi:hypothetical protein